MDKELRFTFILCDQNHSPLMKQGRKMIFACDAYKDFPKKERKEGIERRVSDFIENIGLILNRNKEKIVEEILAK